MTHELLLVLLATRAEFASPKTCRKQLVGPMRRYLSHHDGKEMEAVPMPAPMPPKALALIGARREAAAELADFCARCGRCREEKILDFRAL
jgi:hypothetical protein